MDWVFNGMLGTATTRLLHRPDAYVAVMMFYTVIQKSRSQLKIAINRWYIAVCSMKASNESANEPFRMLRRLPEQSDTVAATDLKAQSQQAYL